LPERGGARSIACGKTRQAGLLTTARLRFTCGHLRFTTYCDAMNGFAANRKRSYRWIAAHAPCTAYMPRAYAWTALNMACAGRTTPQTRPDGSRLRCGYTRTRRWRWCNDLLRFTVLPAPVLPPRRDILATHHRAYLVLPLTRRLRWFVFCRVLGSPPGKQRIAFSRVHRFGMRFPDKAFVWTTTRLTFRVTLWTFTRAYGFIPPAVLTFWVRRRATSRLTRTY